MIKDPISSAMLKTDVQRAIATSKTADEAARRSIDAALSCMRSWGLDLHGGVDLIERALREAREDQTK